MKGLGLDSTKGIFKLLQVLNVNLSTVSEIDLSYNLFTTLDDSFIQVIEAAEDLRTLLLNHNKLENLPNNFLVHHPNLETLDLRENNLKTLPNNFLSEAPNLDHLWLCCNRLESLPEPFFLNKSPMLRLLDIGCNYVKWLPLPINLLSQLERLGLYHNQLTELPKPLFEIAPKLARVILDENPLPFNSVSRLPAAAQMAVFEGCKDWKTISADPAVQSWLEKEMDSTHPALKAMAGKRAFSPE